MDTLQQELVEPFRNSEHIVRVLVRLILAMLLGAPLGLERYHEGKAAGMRTYMMVCLGSALFTLIASEAHMATADMSRIIQGIAAGLGFLGAGTIIKSQDQHRVEGLTTAAAIWMAAAAGAAVGLGLVWVGIASVALAWFILFYLGRVEHWLKTRGL
jgi:putative Mg2+ transporter-C (MgtC) family protein